MPDFITSSLAELCQGVNFTDACFLIDRLIQVNAIIPDEIKDKRPSLVNFNTTIKWGGTVEQSFTAALSALNGKHGCFADAYRFISSGELRDCYRPNKKTIIPGFGNPVFKDVDYRCEMIKAALKTFIDAEKFNTFITQVERWENELGVKSNLVFWNAATVYCLGFQSSMLHIHSLWLCSFHI